MFLDELMPYLPLIIPLVLLDLGLKIAVWIDIYKQPKLRGPKWMWVLISLVNLIGPIVYFVVAREDA
ncbi:MAG: PLDc N-terminal domain-containing protein [Anaerolineae bacterium]|nr:PLDc N-terminal domain-containing protein [Anaerolineae bacterium]